MKKLLSVLLLVLVLTVGSALARTGTPLVKDATNLKVQCFAPRGELALSTTPLDVTRYLAVKFIEDASVTVTWQDTTTTVVEVVAGETWAIDREYIKTIATAVASTALWM